MSLAELWYVLLVLTFVGYWVLDGFDLGAGAIHFVVAKTQRERRVVTESLGPVWDGNEVWLLAAGGTMFFAFPELYARIFSGFYLPVMFVLWLLIGRALGIEMKHQLSHRVWIELWDFVFSAASAALLFLLGTLVGNLVRGVALDPERPLSIPLWSTLSPRQADGFFDPYTVLIGVVVSAGLALHGALWLAHRTDDVVQARSLALAKTLAIATGVLGLVGCGVTLLLFPELKRLVFGSASRLLALALPFVALAGVAAFLRRADARAGFRASCAMVASSACAVCALTYPILLRDPIRPEMSKSISNLALPDRFLAAGLPWWLFGMAIAISYFVWMYRSLPACVSLSDHSDADPH